MFTVMPATHCYYQHFTVSTSETIHQDCSKNQNEIPQQRRRDTGLGNTDGALALGYKRVSCGI